jgi:hypothetical protein
MLAREMPAPVRGLDVQELSVLFQPFYEWKFLAYGEKRRLLAAAGSQIRVADYRIDGLYVSLPAHHNENTRRGAGFMAAASMKRAGNVSDMVVRAMETLPSSSGWRITSNTVRGNSGSSSRNSTPLCASETSPGRGTMPPPRASATPARCSA